jgi:hypothetical protein
MSRCSRVCKRITLVLVIRGPVHSTNNNLNYSTVAVNDTSSRNMKVTIPNDRPAISLITVLYTSRWTHPQAKRSVRNPHVYGTNTTVCKCRGSLRSKLAVVHTGCKYSITYNKLMQWITLVASKVMNGTTPYITQGRYWFLDHMAGSNWKGVPWET